MIRSLYFTQDFLFYLIYLEVIHTQTHTHTHIYIYTHTQPYKEKTSTGISHGTALSCRSEQSTASPRVPVETEHIFTLTLLMHASGGKKGGDRTRLGSLHQTSNLIDQLKMFIRVPSIPFHFLSLFPFLFFWFENRPANAYRKDAIQKRQVCK